MGSAFLTRSSICRDSETEPQRFRYATRIGFGVEVAGEGETVGERDLADGSRSSALKFGSDDPLSIIREGSGYWKYIPTADGIRFLTWYDYRTRFGAVGRAVRPIDIPSSDRLGDRLEFRSPATVARAACDPAQAMRQTLVHASRGSGSPHLRVSGPRPQAARRDTRTRSRCSATPASRLASIPAVIVLGIWRMASRPRPAAGRLASALAACPSVSVDAVGHVCGRPELAAIF